ncbi:DNA polymerase sigma, putative [Bodo saltans]|uniref:DNA polymerase sigma, putative n=1 Tax=Bodo saltans TaxID=75058 RepID=A0A0S4J889_BODSA|nr:DNA polymerase sigma, putative [Bodo saltans]|eukprot:CUG86136.1 DNA polymerase sigma, putative [Bodo saltans]
MNDGDAPSVAGPSQNVVVSAFGMDPSAPAPLDLFEKFRNKNSMFSDWLLPPEADVNAKPISDDVANKLRARQAAMVSRSAQPLVEGAEDIKSPVTSSTTPTIAAREDAGGFDGDYFSFGPKVLSEKEAVVSKMSSENLQAVVSVAGTSAVQTATTDFRRRRSAVLVPVEIQRTVPLWSLQRFQVAGGYADNALVALHQEILDLVDFLSPSQGEVTLRRYIELEVTKMAKKFWPECEPCVYGSLTTHLLLPLSDIDMSILNVPVSTEEALTALCREVANSKLCSSAYPQLILKTKVPLLKFTHRGSLLDVDVSINAGDGKRNSDIVKGYLEDYPEARPLIIVVKYFLQQRDMHEPYHGGMGSFATTLLVISFLQHHPIYTTRPQDRPHTGLGKLLVDFFRYYGTCFNSHRCGISLENGGFYFIRKQSSAMTDFRGMANQVILEDPGNRSNNAASSLRQFPTIASSFAHAYAALTAVFPLINEGSGMSPDSEHIAGRPTILSRILHIDPSSVARRQCIVETFESYLDDAEMSAVIDVATDYCRAEDAPMLVRSPLSTVQTSQSGKPSASQNSDAPHKGASTSRQSTPLVRGAAEFPTTTDEAPPSASKRQSKRTRQDDDQESSPKEPRAPRRMYQRPNY